MKPSETKPTKEEILEKHTKDSQWYPPVCDTRVLKAMQEYADLYHKEKLRDDLIEFHKFYLIKVFGKNDPININVSTLNADEYLKTKP
jgi:hypothetical protein